MMNNELEWANLGHYYGISLEKLRKGMKTSVRRECVPWA
jgi:hypothetical protein